MKLSKLFEEGKFVITSEVGPPKGIELDGIFKEVELVKDKVDAYNVTDLQSSVMRLGSLAVSHILKEKGYESIYQLTCRDRNRLALQSDILSAAVLGIENLLLLTGDHPKLGDHPGARTVFDLDSVQLLTAVKGLMEGRDIMGNELKGKAPEFCIGAVVHPGADPMELQIMKMEKKVEAGAQFFQTQAVYDAGEFARFMEQVKQFNIPVMAGIVFLKSVGMAKFMNKNVAGVSVPESLIKEMDVEKEKRPEVSIDIAARLLNEMKDICQGVHIMALGWERYMPEVLEKAGI